MAATIFWLLKSTFLPSLLSTRFTISESVDGSAGLWPDARVYDWIFSFPIGSGDKDTSILFNISMFSRKKLSTPSKNPC
jgi:hypothetical protein